MKLFESVRMGVTAREAAERYGIKVKRNGMACCPFHEDRHPSMKLDKRFHCFGCQADGDAIDLVGRLYGLEPVDAARKLAADFGILYEENRKQKSKRKANSAAENSQDRRTAKVEKQMKRWLRHAEDVLLRYREWLRFWEQFHCPETMEEEWHPLFCEALNKKSWIDYLLDELMLGDDTDRLDFSAAIGRR